jgi:hypothetical protein
LFIVVAIRLGMAVLVILLRNLQTSPDHVDIGRRYLDTAGRLPPEGVAAPGWHWRAISPI